MCIDQFCFYFCHVVIKKIASMLYSYGWELNAMCTAGRGIQLQRVLYQLPLSFLTLHIAVLD